MTAESVFKYYRAYKFFYSGKSNDLKKYANIKCPALIQQRDRSFYYRISQRLNDAGVHALFHCGFFFEPHAHVSQLATTEAIAAASIFAARAENGETLLQADLYELKKRLTPDTLDAWLYGEYAHGQRAVMPGCLQDVINGELPLDVACLVLLIPQRDLNYHWIDSLNRDTSTDLGLGSAPWRDRLTKADQLINLHRTLWRAVSQRLAKEFWHSFSVTSLAPIRYVRPTESSLF